MSPKEIFDEGICRCIFFFFETIHVLERQHTIRRETVGLTRPVCIENSIIVAQLQRIGVTMQAYNGAFNNTTNPIAVDAQAQFM